jgi:hypothetical protein
MPDSEILSGESSTKRGARLPGMRTHWTWFIGLLLAELALALLLPALDLPDDAPRRWPVSSIASFAPVISNFGSAPGIDPTVPVYIAITLVLSPLKVLFWILWLRSDSGKRLAVFVPSPRRFTSRTVDDFVLDRNTRDKEEHTQAESLSAKGFVYSVLLAVLFIGGVYMYLNWGWELTEGKAATLPSIRASYLGIASGGFSLWANWGARNVVGAFFLAVVVMIAREYVLLFRQFR